MSSKDFVHLHVHTEYSVLDGINKVDKLCKHVKDCGMKACAITDHATMGGVVEFYKAAKKVGIKPILGVEAYVTWDQDGLENVDKHRDNAHLVMLAKTEQGFRNLISLTNKAYLSNFYYKPRMSIVNFGDFNTDGIIATSACLGGVISKAGILDPETKTFTDPEGDALLRLELFAKLFPGRFYAEVQDFPKSWAQLVYNEWLIKAAKSMDIPLVITSDAHFLTEDDFQTHRLVMAKNMNILFENYANDEDGLIYHKEHHIRAPKDMYEAACKMGVEEAFSNTAKIAKECDVELTLDEYKFPHFDIAAEDDYQEFLEWQKQQKSLNEPTG